MASARRARSDIEDEQVLALLTKYLPPIIARSVLDRARREAVWNPEGTWADPNGLLDRLSIGVRLFAAPTEHAAILRELTDLAAATVPVDSTKRPHDSARSGPPSGVEREEAPITLRTAEEAATAGEPAGSMPRSDATTVRRPPDLSSVLRSGDAAPQSRGIFRTHVARPAPHGSPSAPDGHLGSMRNPSAHTASPWGSTPATSAHPTPAPVSPPPLSTRTIPSPRGSAPGSGPRSAAIPSSRHDPADSTRRAFGRPDARLPPPSATPRIVSDAADRSIQARETTVTLVAEQDIPRARQVAREICESLHARALTQQRVVTIVSELSRNMVSYAGGGQMTFRVPANDRRIVILAIDQGPGISNLQDILGGRYKSRSGLGLGIIGTRRLADAFDIETGRNGTTVRVEVVIT